MHRQHTTYIKQDAIITIRWYLATCFGRDWPSSGQLGTILRYSKNSTQWDPISFILNFDKIWKLLLKFKTLEQYSEMVKPKLHVLYSGLRMVHTLIVLCIKPDSKRWTQLYSNLRTKLSPSFWITLCVCVCVCVCVCLCVCVYIYNKVGFVCRYHSRWVLFVHCVTYVCVGSYSCTLICFLVVLKMAGHSRNM